MKIKIIDCFNPYGNTLQEKYLQIKHLINKEFEMVEIDGQNAINFNKSLIDIFEGEYEIV